MPRLSTITTSSSPAPMAIPRSARSTPAITATILRPHSPPSTPSTSSPLPGTQSPHAVQTVVATYRLQAPGGTWGSDASFGGYHIETDTHPDAGGPRDLAAHLIAGFNFGNFFDHYADTQPQATLDGFDYP